MNAQTDELDKHITHVMEQISEAASKHDLAKIQQLTRRAAEFQDLKQQTEAIHKRIASLTDEIEGTALPPPSGGIRELPIEVTDGMIRQNLLTLTPHIKSRKIKVGEELVIEALPSGDRFKTDLVEKGNKLRARSEIGAFYRAAKVKGGDYVL